MTEEKIDILNQKGKKLGIKVSKGEAHGKGLWHQAAHVWIYNSNGEILLQKRSMEKDSWPGRWDISAAWHLSAGENPEQAAIREMKEEIGVKADKRDLKKIFVSRSSTIPMPGYYNNEFDHVFIFKLDHTPKRLQSEEVAKVKFIPIQKFEREIKDKEKKQKYVPHKYYQKLIKILKKLKA